MLESSGISIGHAQSIATRSERAGVLIPLISDDSPTKRLLGVKARGVLLYGKMGKGLRGCGQCPGSICHISHIRYSLVIIKGGKIV